jgi:hypothetical protein
MEWKRSAPSGFEPPQPVQQTIREKQADADNRHYDGGEE